MGEEHQLGLHLALLLSPPSRFPHQACLSNPPETVSDRLLAETVGETVAGSAAGEKVAEEPEAKRVEVRPTGVPHLKEHAPP